MMWQKSAKTDNNLQKKRANLFIVKELTIQKRTLPCRPADINEAEKWATSWQNQQNHLCVQWRLRSAWASPQSGQSIRSLRNE